MSDITLLGFDPAGIGKGREKMKTLKDMSGEHMLEQFGHDSEASTEFGMDLKAELLRLIDLGKIASKHTTIVMLNEQIGMWRERAEKAAAALTKISAIRDSIVAMQGFNFSEHAYPLVAALDEAGFEGVGYELAVKNFGTTLEQLRAAESERDQARAERDGLEILYKAEFKLVTALNGQLSTARTALTEISRLAQRGEEKPEIIMKNRFGLIRIASRGALDALTPPEAATSEKAE